MRCTALLLLNPAAARLGGQAQPGGTIDNGAVRTVPQRLSFDDGAIRTVPQRIPLCGCCALNLRVDGTHRRRRHGLVHVWEGDVREGGGNLLNNGGDARLGALPRGSFVSDGNVFGFISVSRL